VKLGGGLANTIALTLTEHLLTNGQRRTAPPLKGTAVGLKTQRAMARCHSPLIYLVAGARNYLSEAGRWEFRFKVTT
jgi:hypothetical protein